MQSTQARNHRLSKLKLLQDPAAWVTISTPNLSFARYTGSSQKVTTSRPQLSSRYLIIWVQDCLEDCLKLQDDQKLLLCAMELTVTMVKHVHAGDGALSGADSELWNELQDQRTTKSLANIPFQVQGELH